MDRRYPQQQDQVQEEAGRPCSRQPPELCDGARVVTMEDGSSKRVPMLTPRTFCEPCRSRIITCLGEIPAAYVRLGHALGDAPKTGGSGVRGAVFGPSIPIRAEIDAIMRVIAAILPGWEARVRGNPRLNLTPRDPERDLNTPESVRDAAETLARNIDVLLSLEDARMSRTFTFPFAKPGKTYAARKAPIPAETEAEIGDEEILRGGDGWVTVAPLLDGASAGNEIITLHYRARRQLGETKPAPDSFDGIPCRACEAMTLERAEPPSDPSLPANHSKCPGCGDEMDRETFAQWADTYAQWAKGAGIKLCKRCSLAGSAATPEKAAAMHAECSWAHCACSKADHPRRRAAA